MTGKTTFNTDEKLFMGTLGQSGFFCDMINPATEQLSTVAGSII